jgi:hypothetical protein
MLPRLRPHRPGACLLRNVVTGEIGRQLSILLERPPGANGTLRTTPGAAIVAAMTSGSSLCFAAPW